MVDLALLFSAATLGVLVLTFVFLRLSIPRLVDRMRRQILNDALSLAFDSVDVAQADGSVKKQLKPTPQFQALLAQLTPMLIGQVVEWAKANVKLQPGQAAGPGQIGPEAILTMIPKKFQGVAALFLPYIQKFLGGAKGVAGAEGGTAGNPFLEGAK